MLALIKDLLRIKSKSKKTIKGAFTLPIESISDLIECKDGIYKIVLKVSPVNGELLSRDSLEMISDSIQGAFSSFDGRIGIYIQSESVDIDTNIANIEKLMSELNSEIKLVLLE